MGGSEKTVVQAIIKRKIGNPEEPQENAGWKVAYDDFVTAMMAFFMVIWLLSSVNEDQRRGIAGYFHPSSDLNRTETGSQSMLYKGILHGGDTLDAAREAKLESLEAQSSSADERHQNAAQKDLKAIKTLFSDLYKEKLGRPLSEAQIGFHLSDEGFQFDFFESKGTELFDASQNPGNPSQPSPLSSDFNAFLNMLTTQLKHQDPLNPVDSADYALQLAAFSTAEKGFY